MAAGDEEERGLCGELEEISSRRAVGRVKNATGAVGTKAQTH